MHGTQVRGRKRNQRKGDWGSQYLQARRKGWVNTQGLQEAVSRLGARRQSKPGSGRTPTNRGTIWKGLHGGPSLGSALLLGFLCTSPPPPPQKEPTWLPSVWGSPQTTLWYTSLRWGPPRIFPAVLMYKLWMDEIKLKYKYKCLFNLKETHIRSLYASIWLCWFISPCIWERDRGWLSERDGGGCGCFQALPHPPSRLWSA